MPQGLDCRPFGRRPLARFFWIRLILKLSNVLLMCTGGDGDVKEI